MENMVLQRNKPFKIGGVGIPGIEVEITFDVKTQKAVADEYGKWAVIFPPHTKGGPYQLKVQSANQVKVIHEVYVGEVLLCTGQSNMDIFYNNLHKEFDFVFLDNPHIKYLSTTTSIVEDKGIDKPYFDISPGVNNFGEGEVTSWLSCTAENAKLFTAVGYATAYHLLKSEPDLYIGVVMAAEGGAALSSYLKDGKNYYYRVAPFLNYTVGAILWYQGESDEESYQIYASTVAQMINDWREAFGEDDLPFFYAQLPRYIHWCLTPNMQDSQRRIMNASVLHNHRNIGMVVTIDTDRGTATNPDGDFSIHPGGKAVIGARFAMLYKKHVWGEKEVVASGPLYQSARIEGNSIMVTFNCVGEGLVIQDVDNSWAVENLENGNEFDNSANSNQKLCEFEVAGADKDYHRADAIIVADNMVKVFCVEEQNPIYVRYAFSSYPHNPNLANSAGLPASPFTTEY